MLKRKTFLGFLLFSIISFFSLYFLVNVNIINKNLLPYKIEIKEGYGISKLADKLHEEGVINSKILFKIVFKLKSRQQIKYGEYLIESNSMADLINKLENEDTITYRVSFPEGITTHQFLEIVNNNEMLIGENATFKLDGYLLPETYSFKKGDTKQSIIDRANKDMLAFLAKNQEQINNHYLTAEELIILASIVEKETPISAEKPLVAGVYINRLKYKMKLQADPTVIYGITNGKENFSRYVTYKDLKHDSKYNTYINYGLPIGAIGNPSKETIMACLNYRNHGYLYFVADGNGGHIFSNTYDEHLMNVANYRKVRNEKQKQN
jgi:UPF0755 protein